MKSCVGVWGGGSAPRSSRGWTRYRLFWPTWPGAGRSTSSRSSSAVVIRCRTPDGRPTVLKVSPERGRGRDEAAALARWEAGHVSAVLAVDECVGALLIEAIEPGTSLAESMTYPRLDSLAALMTSLHTRGMPDPSYRPVAERVAYLYNAGRKNYERRPDLAALVSPELYERGRELALRLAADAPATVLLHGDMTPTTSSMAGNSVA